MSDYQFWAVILTVAGGLATFALFQSEKRKDLYLVIALVCLVIAMIFVFTDMDQSGRDFHNKVTAALQRLEPNAVLGDEVSRHSGIYWVTQGKEHKILTCVPDFDHCVVYVPQTPPQ